MKRGNNMIINTDYVEIIRERRVVECFTVINRGFLWYNRLNNKQLNELDEWYQKWLDAPKTGVIPAAPEWINDKIVKETEEILI